MKKLKELVIPAILSIVFIGFSGFIAFSNYSIGWFQTFCFYFHLIPFGIGFSSRDGSGGVIILFYYIILWGVLTILFLGLTRLFALIFKRSV